MRSGNAMREDYKIQTLLMSGVERKKILHRSELHLDLCMLEF